MMVKIFLMYNIILYPLYFGSDISYDELMVTLGSMSVCLLDISNTTEKSVPCYALDVDIHVIYNSETGYSNPHLT